MFVSAITNALNLHFVHKLAKRIHPFVNAHYSHFAFLGINATLSQFSSKKVELTDMSFNVVTLLLTITLLSLLSQYCIMMANNIKQPSLMMPFGYVSVVVGFGADIYLFGT